MKLSIEGTCLCGAVAVGAARVPRQVTQCNCSVCRKYGTLWAYYPRAAVSIVARRGLAGFTTKGGELVFSRCKTCGCIVSWDVPGEERMAINARLLDHARMSTIPIKVLDGDGPWTKLEVYTKPGIWISPRRSAR